MRLVNMLVLLCVCGASVVSAARKDPPKNKPSPGHCTACCKASKAVLGSDVDGPKFKFDRTPETPICSIKAFKEAFIARTPITVAPNIVMRLITGARDRAEAISYLAGNLLRPLTFFSYNDIPSKYARIGYPKSIGEYTLGYANSINGRGGYNNPDFEGLEEASNWLAFQEQIGYSSPDSSLSGKFYLLIMERPNNVASFVPTWHNLHEYYNKFLAFYYKTPANFVSDAVLKIIQSSDFDQLTGCKAQCTYQDTLFNERDPADPTKFIGNATIPSSAYPAVVGSRNSSASPQCSPRYPSYARAAFAGKFFVNNDEVQTNERFKLTEPTQFESMDENCIREDGNNNWVTYMRQMGRGTGTCGFDRPSMEATARKFIELYNQASNDVDRALIFRAFLASYCGGGFNALFTGNGFTASGNGGSWASTGNEILIANLTLPADVTNTTLILDVCIFPAGINTTAGIDGRC